MMLYKVSWCQPEANCLFVLTGFVRPPTLCPTVRKKYTSATNNLNKLIVFKVINKLVLTLCLEFRTCRHLLLSGDKMQFVYEIAGQINMQAFFITQLTLTTTPMYQWDQQSICKILCMIRFIAKFYKAFFLVTMWIQNCSGVSNIFFFIFHCKIKPNTILYIVNLKRQTRAIDCLEN